MKVEPGAAVGDASAPANAEGFRCPRLMRSGFSLGCGGDDVVLMLVGRARGALLAVPETQLSCWELTVGGGLGLPSESSTFALVRLASCSRRKARSNRIFSTWRLRRASRSRAASFDSSTSFVRCFSWMHFRRYASSTVGGSGGGADVAAGREEAQSARYSIAEANHQDIGIKR